MQVTTIRFLALLAMVSQTAAAQVIQSRQPSIWDQWIAGINGVGVFPQGEFRQQDNFGAGVEINLGFQPFRRQPLVLRGDVGWMQYDGYNRNDSQEVCDWDGSNCQNETVFYDSQSHNMWWFHGGSEVMATHGIWRPYAYAAGGWTLFYSSARFGPAGFSGSEGNRLHAKSSLTSAYGIGVRRVTARDGRQYGWDFAVSFTRNAKAEYVTMEGVYRNPDGSYAVRPTVGGANVLKIHIGITSGPNVHWSER
jgi:hypothetical protein